MVLNILHSTPFKPLKICPKILKYIMIKDNVRDIGSTIKSLSVLLGTINNKVVTMIRYIPISIGIK